jgi:predicted XRE-type DNA-binding protein
MHRNIRVEESSGNVFADIGLSKPEERLAKADLAIRIAETIRARRLTQTRAARILKIDQPKISRLLQGRLSGFSTERLMHFLTLLGRDVEIVVKRAPRSRRQGRVRVIAHT